MSIYFTHTRLNIAYKKEWMKKTNKKNKIIIIIKYIWDERVLLTILGGHLSGTLHLICLSC